MSKSGAPKIMPTEISLNSRVLIQDDVLFQELQGEAVLLNLKTGVYLGLNQIGTSTCANWTDATAASQSVFGTANYTGTNAFYGFSDGCNRGGIVYCLQD